jgi:hypothetical protein
VSQCSPEFQLEGFKLDDSTFTDIVPIDITWAVFSMLSIKYKYELERLKFQNTQVLREYYYTIAKQAPLYLGRSPAGTDYLADI